MASCLSYVFVDIYIYIDMCIVYCYVCVVVYKFLNVSFVHLGLRAMGLGGASV